MQSTILTIVSCNGSGKTLDAAREAAAADILKYLKCMIEWYEQN